MLSLVKPETYNNPMEFFLFEFNPFAVLSLVSFLLSICLLLLIYSKSRFALIHKWLMLFILTFSLWSFGEFLSRLSQTPAGSIFWEKFSALGWIFVAPVGVAFILCYSGREKYLSSITRLGVLFGPAFLFLFFTYATNSVFDWRPENSNRLFFGWNQSAGSVFNFAVFPWIVLLQLIGMWTLIKFYFKEKDLTVRKQTAVLITAFITIILLSGISNGILQIIHSENFVRMGVFSSSLMTLFITYAVFKYKLLNINPGLVVENIVDTMNEIVLVVNPSQKIEFANSAVENLLGYQKGILLGQDLGIILSSNKVDFKAAFDFFLKGGQEVSDLEVDALSRSGEKIPVSLSVSAFKDTDGKVLDIVIVVTDLRKIQELFNVTVERNKLNAVTQTISDGIVVLDIHGKVVLVNQSACRMIDTEENSLLHQYFDDFVTLTDNDDIYKITDIIPDESEVKGSVVAVKKQFKLSTKGGKVLYVNLISSAIERGREIGIGAILTIQDISKERALEEMKLDFVSMAAHELRTPLTSIKSYLSVFISENMQKLNDDQKMFINRISIASQQLINLVENLLSVARIERGAFLINPEPTDWTQLVKDVVKDFQITSSDKNLKVELVPPSSPIPYVQADKIRITEVLNNLISNAINYTNSGGLISVRIEAKDGFILTHIKDTGKGISKESQAHLFTKFYRVSSSIDSGSKGNGLGLYISKAIIDLHRGKIWVNSELGQGSEFSFSIPVAAKPIMSFKTPYLTPAVT